MIVGLPLRSLVRRRGRTALALLGIAVSAGLLLDMTMLASGLTHSFGELTRAQGYGLRVTPSGTLPFDSEAGIRGAAEVQRAIMALDGVAAVTPMLGAQLYRVEDEAAGEALFTTGINAASQMLYLLLEGSDPGTGEVVVSRPLAEATGLGPGDTLALAPELDVALRQPRGTTTFTVSGIGDFLYDYAGQRSLAAPIAEVQELTRRPDEVSLLAVSASEGADEDVVAAAIEASVPGISAYSTRELMVQMEGRLSYFRQLSTILGSIALVVAGLLVGTIVTIGVRERFGEIATLRALGVSARRLQLGIVVEGLALTLAGCALGVPLGIWLAGRLDRILLGFPGIPARVSFFVFEPVAVVGSVGVILAVGALVGVLPGLQAVRAPLGSALREEAD